MAFDPVDIAMQNAVVPLSQRAVEAQQGGINARNDQVFAQTQQAQSMAQRSRQMDIQQQQFDIVQQLQQDKFGLEKQQSLAQVAAINADTSFKTQQLQDAQKNADIQFNVMPAANQSVTKAFAAGMGTTDPDEAVQTFNDSLSPNATQYIPASQLDAVRANLRAQVAQSSVHVALQNQNAADLQTIQEGVSLGIHPSDFVNANADPKAAQSIAAGQIGPAPRAMGINMDDYTAAVTQAKVAVTTRGEQTAENIKTEGQLQTIKAIGDYKNQIAQTVSSERYDARIASIQQKGTQVQAATALGELNSLIRMSKISGGTPSPELAQNIQAAKAKLDNILNGAGVASPNAAPPSSTATPPAAGSSWNDRVAALPATQPTFIGPDGKTYSNPNYQK